MKREWLWWAALALGVLSVALAVRAFVVGRGHECETCLPAGTP